MSESKLTIYAVIWHFITNDPEVYIRNKLSIDPTQQEISSTQLDEFYQQYILPDSQLNEQYLQYKQQIKNNEPAPPPLPTTKPTVAKKSPAPTPTPVKTAHRIYTVKDIQPTRRVQPVVSKPAAAPPLERSMSVLSLAEKPPIVAVVVSDTIGFYHTPLSRTQQTPILFNTKTLQVSMMDQPLYIVRLHFSDLCLNFPTLTRPHLIPKMRFIISQHDLSSFIQCNSLHFPSPNQNPWTHAINIKSNVTIKKVNDQNIDSLVAFIKEQRISTCPPPFIVSTIQRDRKR